MKTAINFLFWGYFLIVFNLDIGIDLLPDPLGYILIATGCSKLQTQYPVAQKAWIFSTLMIFVSFPTVFVNIGETTSLGWNIYSIALMILKLIVVFFLFSVLLGIANEYGESGLLNRTNRVYSLFISLNLLFLTALSFAINMPEVVGGTIMIVLIIATLIMEFVFLALLRAIRRAIPNTLALEIEENKPTFIIEEDHL